MMQLYTDIAVPPYASVSAGNCNSSFIQTAISRSTSCTIHFTFVINEEKQQNFEYLVGRINKDLFYEDYLVLESDRIIWHRKSTDYSQAYFRFIYFLLRSITQYSYSRPVLVELDKRVTKGSNFFFTFLLFKMILNKGHSKFHGSTFPSRGYCYKKEIYNIFKRGTLVSSLQIQDLFDKKTTADSVLNSFYKASSKINLKDAIVENKIDYQTFKAICDEVK